MRTKWEILESRLEKAKREVESLQGELDGLARTPFFDGKSGCSQCRTLLPTEKDFAQHFIVDDERYINLGHCPMRDQKV